MLCIVACFTLSVAQVAYATFKHFDKVDFSWGVSWQTIASTSIMLVASLFVHIIIMHEMGKESPSLYMKIQKLYASLFLSKQNCW